MMPTSIDRRRFLKGALGASGALALGARILGPARASAPLAAVKAPSGIDHIVMVMMENRSFDHFLGWLPNANGRVPRSGDDGLSYVDSSGTRHPIYHLTEHMGCAHPDPDHSWEGGRHQYDGGRMDGFASGNNDIFAIGYYNAADRPFMSQLALNYTTCDNYFCSILAETYPNRFFSHAGATDRLHNSQTMSTLPTIWDQLNQPGKATGRYYFSDLPFLALWGTKYVSAAAPYAQFLADCASGSLPNVSYVDPRFEDEGSGTSGDDHPHAHIGAGDAFLAQVFHAVSSGPNWDRTVLVVTYDEWGGFFEHVVPPRVTAPNKVDTDVDKRGRVLLGFRVPTIVASPFTRGNPASPRVEHGLYDHTSILKFIESNFGLHPVAARDASKLSTDPGDLAAVLSAAHDPKVPAAIPASLTPPVVVPCQAADATGVRTENATWAGLRASGLLAGWGVG